MKRTGTLIGLVVALALIAGGVVAYHAWPALASLVSRELPSELPSEVAADLPSADVIMGENPVAMTNALAPCAAPGFPQSSRLQTRRGPCRIQNGRG